MPDDITTEYRRVVTSRPEGHLSRRGQIRWLDECLHSIGAKRHYVSADGNCLYRSLCHQLKVLGKGVMKWSVLKKRIFHRMKTNPVYRERLATEVSADFASFDDYLSVKEKGKGVRSWGGLPEVMVFCDEFDIRVSIFTVSAGFFLVPSDNPAPTQNALVAHVGGNHYDSVVTSERTLSPMQPVRREFVFYLEGNYRYRMTAAVFDEDCIIALAYELWRSLNLNSPFQVLISSVWTPTYVQLDSDSFDMIVSTYDSISVKVLDHPSQGDTTGRRMLFPTNSSEVAPEGQWVPSAERKIWCEPVLYRCQIHYLNGMTQKPLDISITSKRIYLKLQGPKDEDMHKIFDLTGFKCQKFWLFPLQKRVFKLSFNKKKVLVAVFYSSSEASQFQISLTSSSKIKGSQGYLTFEQPPGQPVSIKAPVSSFNTTRVTNRTLATNTTNTTTQRLHATPEDSKAQSFNQTPKLSPLPPLLTTTPVQYEVQMQNLTQIPDPESSNLEIYLSEPENHNSLRTSTPPPEEMIWTQFQYFDHSTNNDPFYNTLV